MSYQNFTNEPTMAGTQSNTTVIHSGQPVVATVQQRPFNSFAMKAEITKKLGIVQVVMGVISIIIGIIMIPVSPFYFGSLVGGGIWGGIFIIISGALCIAAGSNPDVYGTRCGALVMCIISLCSLGSCGLMNFVGFVVGVSCTPDCYYSYNEQRTICWNNCSDIQGAGIWLSLLLSIIMIVLFIITLLSAIYTGRGCCSGGHPSGYVITQPVLAPGGVITASNLQTTSHPGSYSHQGYAPPTSAGYPPSSTGYPPSSTGYPQSSGGYPHTSYAPPSSHQPYSTQGQQYTQASTAQGGVTYGAEYNQQKAGIPEASIGEAPPAYNPNQ